MGDCLEILKGFNKGIPNYLRSYLDKLCVFNHVDPDGYYVLDVHKNDNKRFIDKKVVDVIPYYNDVKIGKYIGVLVRFEANTDGNTEYLVIILDTGSNEVIPRDRIDNVFILEENIRELYMDDPYGYRLVGITYTETTISKTTKPALSIDSSYPITSSKYISAITLHGIHNIAFMKRNISIEHDDINFVNFRFYHILVNGNR